MSQKRKLRRAVWLPLCALPIAAMAAGGSIDRKVAAHATGEVSITNVSGSVEVRGWDRNEVQVTGRLGRDVERLDLESSDGRTVIKVVLPRGSNRDADAIIEVQVPHNSTVEVSAVSANVTTRGVLGTQRLKTVSGEITADVAGVESERSIVELRSVSGDITARGDGKPLNLRASSVSGSLDLTRLAGKLELVTVSGDSRVHMDNTRELRARTTSGDMQLRAGLLRDGRVEAEGVSGDITLRLSAEGGFSTDIETFSGDIEGCLASRGVERMSKYGPGSRLNLRTVEAGARVRAKTLSGDIDICDR